MTTVVLDASILLAVILPDERSEEGVRLIEAEANGELDLLVPPVAAAEVCNGVAVALARGRLTLDQAVEALQVFDELGIEPEAPGMASPELLELALAESISVYDATYLALALRAQGLLATLDGALARAARRRSALLESS